MYELVVHACTCCVVECAETLYVPQLQCSGRSIGHKQRIVQLKSIHLVARAGTKADAMLTR